MVKTVALKEHQLHLKELTITG